MIETDPSFGYRSVAVLLGMNKNTVQRIFQLKGWQVRKRPFASADESRPRRREPRSRISAGQPTYIAHGVARMAGSAWLW